MKAGNVQILDQFGRPFSSRPIYKSGSYDDGLQRLPNYLKEPEQLSGRLTRKNLISASRLLYKNNGVVKGAVNMKAEYSIGKAFLFKSLCKNPEVAAKYDEYIKAFYKVACVNGKNFHSLLYLISTAIDIDGDCFVMLTESKTGFPQLQFIRANRVCSPKDGLIDSGKYKGLNVLHGVITNRMGREIAYWLDGDEPGGGEIIPASSMLHLVDDDFLATCRGEPLFSHGLKEFRYIDDINVSELGAMKIASQIALVKKNETGEVDIAQAYSKPGNNGEVVVRNTGDKQIVFLKSEDSLDSLKIERPSPNYMSFSERLLKGVLSGVGVPYDIVVNPDSSGVGNRMSLSKFDNTTRDRATLLEDAARLLAQYVLAVGIQREDIPHAEGWWNMMFSRAKRPSVDMGRDSNSQLKEYNAGIKNLTEICEENGTQVEDHLRIRAREAAIAEKLRREAEAEFGVEISPDYIRKF